MPTRTIEVSGTTWQVAPSGGVTQFVRDEFTMLFTRGTGPDREERVAKYAPLPREQMPKPPPREEDDEVSVLVRDILVRQMGLRPGEADQMIREALARRPDIDAPEALFEEIYRARRGAS